MTINNQIQIGSGADTPLDLPGHISATLCKDFTYLTPVLFKGDWYDVLMHILTHPVEIPLEWKHKQTLIKFASLTREGYLNNDRKEQSYNKLYAFMLDIDCGTTFNKAKEIMNNWGIFYAIYPTISNTDEHNKFRIIIPLDEPIDMQRDLYNRSDVSSCVIVNALQEMFNQLNVDASCFKGAQMQFLPSYTKENKSLYKDYIYISRRDTLILSSKKVLKWLDHKANKYIKEHGTKEEIEARRFKGVLQFNRADDLLSRIQNDLLKDRLQDLQKYVDTRLGNLDFYNRGKGLINNSLKSVIHRLIYHEGLSIELTQYLLREYYSKTHANEIDGLIKWSAQTRGI